MITLLIFLIVDIVVYVDTKYNQIFICTFLSSKVAEKIDVLAITIEYVLVWFFSQVLHSLGCHMLLQLLVWCHFLCHSHPAHIWTVHIQTHHSHSCLHPSWGIIRWVSNLKPKTNQFDITPMIYYIMTDFYYIPHQSPLVHCNVWLSSHLKQMLLLYRLLPSCLWESLVSYLYTWVY